MRAIALFLVLFPALAAAAGAQAQQRVALLIGNAAYQHESALDNPLNDVDAMARALAALGFDVETARNADRRDMRIKLKAFADRARGADTALFFYSGHGMEIAGRNYLIPTDAELRHPDHAEFDAVAVDLAIEAAGRASRLSVVVLDACRNNTFPSAAKSASKGLLPVRASPGQVVAFATAPGTVAYDGDGELSPYTQALTEALAETASTDVRVLFSSLGARVSHLAGAPQEPFVEIGPFPRSVVALSDAQAEREQHEHIEPPVDETAVIAAEREAAAPGPLIAPSDGTCLPVSGRLTAPVRVSAGSRICNADDPTQSIRVARVHPRALRYENGPRGAISCEDGEVCAVFWNVSTAFRVIIDGQQAGTALLAPN